MNARDISEKFDVLNYQSPGRYLLWTSESSTGQEVAAIADYSTGLVRSACDEFWRDWINLKSLGLVKSVSGPENHVDIFIA